MTLFDTEISIRDKLRDYAVFIILFIFVFAAVLIVSKLKQIVRKRIFSSRKYPIDKEEREEIEEFI